LVSNVLKELRLTEGRGTGIPIIRTALKENGSPPPKFDTNDPERTYFIAELPVHPAFMGPSAAQVEVDISVLTVNKLSDADGLIRSLSSSRWDQVRDQVRDQVVQVNKNVLFVLEFCQTPKSRKEICGLLELTNKDSNFKRYAGEPLELGWIEMTSNPHDSDVKYITTENGKKTIEQISSRFRSRWEQITSRPGRFPHA
jgi:ATP-dependent DNA helicase RecG